MWVAGRYTFVSGRFGRVTVARSQSIGLADRALARGALSSFEAQSIVDEQVRLGHTHRLAEWMAGLSGGWSPSSVGVRLPDLVARLRRAVEMGHLVFLRDEGDDAAGALATEADPGARLVRRIMKKRRHLSFEGGSYRVIQPADWPKFHDDHQVVKADQAATLLKRMSEDPRLEKEVQVALAEALPLLTDRPVTAVAPDGVFLLRRVPRSFEAPKTEEPASSPSQLAKEAKKEEPTWLEVVVLDPVGKPYKGKFKIELPDGQIKEDSFGGSGKIRLEDLEPGSVEVRLPDFQEDKKESAA